MSEPYLGQIIIFGGNFAIRGWSLCNGQLLPISQNSALFSLLGTIYGGDGRTTFALPDLRGRTPLHYGSGPGLTTRQLGSRSGVEQVTLLESQIPSHNHSVKTTIAEGLDGGPKDKYLAAGHGQETIYSPTVTPQWERSMAADMIRNTGGGQAHENMQPFLALNYQIAMTGLYPSRD